MYGGYFAPLCRMIHVLKSADVQFPQTSLKPHSSQTKRYNKVHIMSEYSHGPVSPRARRDPSSGSDSRLRTRLVMISSVCSIFLKSVSSQALFPSWFRAPTHYLFYFVLSVIPFLFFSHKYFEKRSSGP